MDTSPDTPLGSDDAHPELGTVDRLLLGSFAVALDVERGAVAPGSDRPPPDHLGAEPWLLHVMAELHPDADRSAALRAASRQGGRSVPPGLEDLDATTVTRAVVLRGDPLVDRLAIEAVLGSGEPVTALIHIDHRVGTIVTDAELLASDLDAVLRTLAVVGDVWASRSDPQRVAAMARHALATPRPPLGQSTTDGWHRLRPALEWMLALAPQGGTGYDAEDLELLRSQTREDRFGGMRHALGTAPGGSHEPIHACDALTLRNGYGLRSRTYGSLLLEEITALVGGSDALDLLDDVPMPQDEAFEWDGVADDIRPVVAEVLELSDRASTQLFDAEIRTGVRRLLHDAAVGDPKVFRRRSSAHTAAAALVCAVASSNHRTDRNGVRTTDVRTFLAVAGSTTSRTRTLLRAASIPSEAEHPQFAARYLTGERRAQVLRLREALGRNPVLRLRVELDGIEGVERIVEVDGHRSLRHLHDVLQVAFGWEGTHFAQFEIGAAVIEVDTGTSREVGWDLTSWSERDPAPGDGWEADDLHLSDVAEVGDRFVYRYDLGDDWVHRITVESIRPLVELGHGCPHLVGAVGAAPPDDIGGPAGYRAVLDAMRAGREHEAAALTATIATPVRTGTFDPWRPDPDDPGAEAVERRLRELRR